MNGALGQVAGQGEGNAIAAALLLLPLLSALAAYVAGLVVLRRGGRSWPHRRTVAFVLGLAAAAATVVGPLADLSRASFAAHVLDHVAVALAAPVLVALSAPVMLALTTMDRMPARRLRSVLRSAPLRVLTHPAVSALLTLSGLWALYLPPAAPFPQNPLLHLFTLGYLGVAGYLLSASILGVDPEPRRVGVAVRAVVLAGFAAGVVALAVALVGSPPAGVPPDQVRPAAAVLVLGAVVFASVATGVLWGQARRGAAPAPAPLDGHPRLGMDDGRGL